MVVWEGGGGFCPFCLVYLIFFPRCKRSVLNTCQLVLDNWCIATSNSSLWVMSDKLVKRKWQCC